MAKRHKGGKRGHRSAFKAASAKCRRELGKKKLFTKAFGACMRREMKKR